MKLDVTNVVVEKGGRRIVDDVSLSVKPTELVGLIGPNGAGKSTLLEVLSGLSVPDQGVVSIDGQPLQRISLAMRSRAIAWLEQAGPINWPLTVERIVALGRRPHLGRWQQLQANDLEAIDRALAKTSCEHLRAQDATTLSGGERARVLLARALASDPEILLADEPVASLDIGHQIQTMTLLKEFVQSQKSCLVILHDLSLASRFCDRLYLMDQGRIVASGAPDHVLSDQNLQSVYSVKVARSSGSDRWIVPVALIDPENSPAEYD